MRDIRTSDEARALLRKQQPSLDEIHQLARARLIMELFDQLQSRLSSCDSSACACNESFWPSDIMLTTTDDDLTRGMLTISFNEDDTLSLAHLMCYARNLGIEDLSTIRIESEAYTPEGCSCGQCSRSYYGRIKIVFPVKLQ